MELVFNESNVLLLARSIDHFAEIFPLKVEELYFGVPHAENLQGLPLGFIVVLGKDERSKLEALHTNERLKAKHKPNTIMLQNHLFPIYYTNQSGGILNLQVPDKLKQEKVVDW